MAIDDPEFYQAPKFSAEYDEFRPKQRGCFFYGCVIASVLAVLLIVALAAGAYLVYRALNRYLEEYTATAPRELPNNHLQYAITWYGLAAGLLGVWIGFGLTRGRKG